MIDFVGISPSLRKALWVAISHSPNRFIYGLFFCIQGVSGNNLTPIQNCPGDARLVKLDPGVVGLRPKSVYL